MLITFQDTALGFETQLFWDAQTLYLLKQLIEPVGNFYDQDDKNEGGWEESVDNVDFYFSFIWINFNLCFHRYEYKLALVSKKLSIDMV